MRRIKTLVDYLTTPRAKLQAHQQREARVLLLMLLVFAGFGLIIAVLFAWFFAASEALFNILSGTLWALLLWTVPYVLAWRTRFLNLALFMSLILFDLAVLTTMRAEAGSAYVLSYLSFLLLPIIMSSIFMRVRHTVSVSAVQLVILTVIYSMLPAAQRLEMVRTVPLSFVVTGVILMTFATMYRASLEKERKQDLAESERLYRNLLAITFESMVVVQNGRIVNTNTSMEQLSGYSRQALVTREAAGLFVAAAPVLEKPMDTVLIHADGTPIPAELISHPIEWAGEDATVYAFRDISERKRAESALLESKNLLEEKVRMRTAELEEMNRGLQIEVTRRQVIEHELRQSQEGLRALYASEQEARWLNEILRDANLSLTQSLDLGVVLDTLLSLLARLIPYDSANVLLFDPAEQLLRVGAHRGYDDRQDTAAGDILEVKFSLEDYPIIEQLLAERRSILVADVEADPQWHRTKPGGHVRCWLGVPLHVAGDALGLYSLDRVEPNSFSEEHVLLAEALAVQAAVAIENARLFEEVNEKQEMLRQFAARELQMLESEHGRISHALHDETGQVLTVLQLLLRSLRDRIPLDGRPTEDPAVMQNQLSRTIELTSQIMKQLRSIAHLLRPAALDDLGLDVALESFCTEYSGFSGLDVHYQGVNVDGVPEIVAISLYRLVQEALTNVARHADATTVVVSLQESQDILTLSIVDDGRGFDLSADTVSRSGMGLLGMRERIRSLGGEICINSAPGSGTTIEARVKLADSV